MTENHNAENFEGIALDGEALAPESILQDEATTAPSLEEVLADSAAQEQAPEDTDKPAKGKEASEPGWIKGRIEAGIRKEAARIRAEVEEALRAEYEQQLRPLREAELDRQAEALVSNGQIADKALALEFLRLKQGLAPDQPAPQQPRNEKGQFVAKEDPPNTPPDDDTQQYGAMLFAQAKAILAAGGPDVMAAFQEHPEIKQRVLSREWDFSDVARFLGQAASANDMPRPTRNTGTGGTVRKQILDMTDAEFDRLNEQLGKGTRVDMRK